MSPRLFLATLLLFPLPAWCCTLWAAAGPDASGGTLIAKNRDWKPDHHQLMKLVRPNQGLAYFGLYAEGNDDPGIKAGINEKGLTVISASSNIPKKLRAQQPGKHGVITPILSRYASVAALQNDADKIFSEARANFFMVADRSQILVAEVGLDGQHHIEVIDKGSISHTNHYLDAQLAATYNARIGDSSSTRLQRIQTLLAESPRPFTVAQFITWSRDQHDGPDNSLWRTGKEHTLASWIVETPANGVPRLHLVIANPGEAETTEDITLDAAFWQKADSH